MTTALFIGRFQPFHNAHLQDIKDILGEHDHVIIGVGSSQESRTTKNPYTFEERKVMIEKALADAGISNYELHAIPDTNNDNVWVAHVESIVGKDYHCVYSGNQLVLDLFKAVGRKTKKIILIPNINGTNIRGLMDEQQEWESLVPSAVAAYLKTIKFKNDS